MLQVCLQVSYSKQIALIWQLGAVLGLSIQAGLLTLKPGDVTNTYNVQVSYWFEMGWCFTFAILVLIFFRDKADPGSEKAKAMEEKQAPATETGTVED